MQRNGKSWLRGKEGVDADGCQCDEQKEAIAKSKLSTEPSVLARDGHDDIGSQDHQQEVPAIEEVVEKQEDNADQLEQNGLSEAEHDAEEPDVYLRDELHKVSWWSTVRLVGQFDPENKSPRNIQTGIEIKMA